jgi:amino acid transporter
MVTRASRRERIALTGLLESARIRFREHRHTALLIAIVAAFAARPTIGENQVATIVFSMMIVVLLLVGLYTTQIDELTGEREKLLATRKRRVIIAWLLAGVAAGERLLQLAVQNHLFALIGSIGWLMFFGFITWIQLRNLLRHKEVTGETISMSISTYLLLGFTWGVLYIVIFLLQPHAFNFGSGSEPAFGADPNTFATLLYFSLTTIATVGYGDITPLSLQARYAAVAEGIFGQFYLAILVARLVAMHMTQSANHHQTRD